MVQGVTHIGRKISVTYSSIEIISTTSFRRVPPSTHYSKEERQAKQGKEKPSRGKLSQVEAKQAKLS